MIYVLIDDDVYKCNVFSTVMLLKHWHVLTYKKKSATGAD